MEDVEGPAKVKARTASEERPPDQRPSEDTVVTKEGCEGKIQSSVEDVLPNVHDVVTPEIDPTQQVAGVEAPGDTAEILSAVTSS